VLDAVRERDAARPRHQKPERDRLGIAIGELSVVGLREKQLAPVGRELRQALVATRHLLDDLVTQEAAEAGGDLGQPLRVARRDRIPGQERADEGQQCWRRNELGAGALDVAFQPDELTL
jgi:hypothetical protein